MSIHAWVIGLVLAGQVNSASDRYPSSGGRQSAATNQSDGRANPTNLVPLIGSQRPGTQSPAESDRQDSGSADPYTAQNQPGVAGPPAYPLGNSGPSSRQGVSPPPPLSGFQVPSDSPSGNSLAGQPTAGMRPAAMMRDMLTPPRDSRLSGESVPLVEVVSGATSRLEQSQRVDAYWDLCSSVADYYLGLREQAELRQLQPTVGGTAWQQAQDELGVRMDTSLRAARASQLRLAGWLGRATGNLPLPADLPHCGSYHSRYQEIFAGRPTPEAEVLAELLPLRYAELKDAAAAVTRAEDVLKTVARESPDGTGTLRALEFLALRRRAFVQIARDYNRRIARYAELASPGEIGAERLIGMLIKTENASTATRQSSLGATGRQSSNTADVPPRTFADGEGWEPAGGRAGSGRRDEAVQPTSGVAPQPPRRERSLLVSPR
jgi:hypothetical protein